MDDEVLDSRGRNITLIIFGAIALVIIVLVWNNYRTKAGWIAAMKSDDAAAQKTAAEAMMKRGQIAEQLQGQKPSVRVAAVRSLAQVRTPEGADQLFQFMKDPDSPVKDLVTRSLTAMGPVIVLNPNDTEKDALHPGLDALTNSDDAVKGGGVSVLVSFGDVVLKPDPRERVTGLPITEMLVNSDARRSTADILVKLGKGEDGRKRDPMMVVNLVVPYRTPAHPSGKVNEEVQLAVVDILDRIPEVRSVPYLIEMLQYPHTQRTAVGALGRKADKRATPYLLKVLATNDLIREETVVALGQIGDPRAVPALVKLLGSYSEKVRLATAEALQRIGLPAAPAVLAAAKSPDPTVRIGAARALGGIQDPEGKARATEIALLNDPDANVRVAAARALGQLPPDPKTADQIVPALIAKFDDPDGRVGDEAALSVSKFIKQAVPALISSLKAGPGSSKVYFASRALQNIGHDAVQPLIAALHSPDPAVAQWSAQLLGQMGDTAALKPLQTAARSSASPQVRWAASRSAERLGGEAAS